MDTIILVLQIVFIMGLAVASWLLTSYFPKYLEEKGKNLATKEDIGEITQITERIRNEMFSELEVVKSNLKVIESYQIRKLDDERKAIIEYCTQLNAYFGELISLKVGGVMDIPLAHY